ncbi:hypothetical protein PG997_002291 [Apiospora hydei]|uniref:Uncharacterized protein n=1 Tax=Apiospora hydei TaxID=1337664 RepID=A0ABR1X8Z5_9PEZI
MASLHSLLWTVLPFLSFIHPSLQASGTLRVNDEHRGTFVTAATVGPSASPIPLVSTQSEPIAVEGAYLVAFEESYRYKARLYHNVLYSGFSPPSTQDDGFLTKLSGELGIQASLRVDLTGEVFNGVSIQIHQNTEDVGDVNSVDDTSAKIATLDEVVAVSPMREHPRPKAPTELPSPATAQSTF